MIASIDETWDRLRFMLREPRRWYGPLRRTALARNVQASNSIEGHNVSLDDAAAAIDGGYRWRRPTRIGTRCTTTGMR